MSRPRTITARVVRPRAAAARVFRAFTLVEILAAMLILTLGVLGLGALFPAVIRQQRISSDAVNGLLATSAARSVLLGTDWDGALPAPGSVFRYIRESDTTLANTDASLFYPYGTWYQPPTDPSQTPNPSPSPGALLLGDPSDANKQVGIGMVARLFPGPESGAVPQFIWDVAFQLDPGDPQNRLVSTGGAPQPRGRLRAAIFARRVDAGIRPPIGKSILQVLTGAGVSPTAQRVAVGEAVYGDKLYRHAPTYDGTNGAGALEYSAIHHTFVSFKRDPTGTTNTPKRDRLFVPVPLGVVPADDAAEFLLISQINQRLVDNLGNVYTVIGSGGSTSISSDPRYVRVDPSIPASVLDTDADVPGTGPQKIFQVIYTPQVPASVVIVEIKP